MTKRYALEGGNFCGKGILWVGFGNLSGLAQETAARFPAHKVADARTAAEGLRLLEVRELFIQPVFLLPGFEYEKLRRETGNLGRPVSIGKPLISSKAEAEKLADIFAAAYKGKAAVFVGHGSKHPAGELYQLLEEALRERCGSGTFVGVLNGEPGFNTVAAGLRAQNIRRLFLVPLMMNAGRHTQNQVVADTGESWRARLEAMEIETGCIPYGLLEYPKVREIFFERLHQSRF